MNYLFFNSIVVIGFLLFFIIYFFKKRSKVNLGNIILKILVFKCYGNRLKAKWLMVGLIKDVTFFCKPLLKLSYSNQDISFLKNCLDHVSFKNFHWNPYYWSNKELYVPYWEKQGCYLSKIFKSKSYITPKLNSSYIVLHFRCSDTPFNSHREYHFQHYNYYKWAFQKLRNFGVTTQELIILSCGDIRITDKEQNLCSIYAQDLYHFLLSLDPTLNINIKAGSITEDFTTMLLADGLISTGGTFSFLAGICRLETFVCPFIGKENNGKITGLIPSMIPPWMYKEDPLLHTYVDSYEDTESVIKKLRFGTIIGLPTRKRGLDAL